MKTKMDRRRFVKLSLIALTSIFIKKPTYFSKNWIVRARIYNWALSDTEVAEIYANCWALYKAPASNTSDVWHFAGGTFSAASNRKVALDGIDEHGKSIAEWE